eukprot:1389073-Amorphochlora_amoeboformis.AAC.1
MSHPRKRRHNSMSRACPRCHTFLSVTCLHGWDSEVGWNIDLADRADSTRVSCGTGMGQRSWALKAMSSER